MIRKIKLPSSLFIHAFVFALCYGLLFYIVQIFLGRSGTFFKVPDEVNLASWDVGFYTSIRDGGYDPQSDNTGFFYLFPFLWRISGFGITGIIILNISLYAAGFGLLMSLLRERAGIKWLLFITLPSMYFNFIPYTEAIFFLLATLNLYAIQQKNWWLVWLTLIVLGWVRATTAFILPALLVMELLTHESRYWWKSILSFCYRYAAPAIIGVGTFTIFQYQQTGIWFATVKKQAEHWGHVFTWPEFPFTNIENGDWRYHWLSILGMFICLLSFCRLVYLGIKWLKGYKTADTGIVYSMGYLTLCLVFVLTMNPKYGGQHTNVIGANRYVFTGPFIIYWVHYFVQRKLSVKEISWILSGLLVFIIPFEPYYHIQRFIAVAAPPLFITICFAGYTRNQQTWVLQLVIMFHFMMQVLLFQQFIAPMYMD